MEELTQKIQQKYIDDLTAKYPIHRFACLYIYLVCIYIYSAENDIRVLDAISQLKINFLFDFSDGLLSKATITMLAISIALTYLGSKISEYIKSGVFELLTLAGNFKDYVIKLKTTIDNTRPNNEAIAWSLTADVSKQLEIKRAKLKSKQASSEILLTLIFCLLIGIKHLTTTDYILILAGVSAITYIQWSSYKSYVADFIPYFVAEQLLLGKEVNFSKDGKKQHD